jgi:hypothetical protein
MSSSYENENIIYTGDLFRPSTSKGTLLVNNGTKFALEPVGTDNQTLIADSSQSTGVKWGNGLNPSEAGEVAFFCRKCFR